MSSHWIEFKQKMAREASTSLANNALFPLQTFASIRIQGIDAKAFLQGQITADINASQTMKASLGALCDPKGRMQANFLLWQGQQEYYLLVKNDIIHQTIKHLRKYALFSKVNIEAPNAEDYAICGANASILPALPSGIEKIAYPGERHLLISQNSQMLIDYCQSAFQQGAVTQADSIWELADINLGIAWLHAATQGLFTPQMFNLDKLGGISFNKGCYIGQEIIARTQHLGKLKRHLIHISFSAPDAPQIGDEIFTTNHTSAGVLVNFASQNAQDYLGLAVIEDRALKSLPLFLGKNIIHLRNPTNYTTP